MGKGKNKGKGKKGKGKMGKGKKSKGIFDLPLCEDGGAEDGGADVVAPTVAPTSSPVASGGSDAVEGEPTVCQKFASGNAPTSGPSRQYDVEIAFVVQSISSTLASSLKEQLETKLVPLLLGCESRRQLQRALQQSGLENMVFAASEADPTGKAVRVHICRCRFPSNCGLTLSSPKPFHVPESTLCEVETEFSCVVVAFQAVAFGSLTEAFEEMLTAGIVQSMTDGSIFIDDFVEFVGVRVTDITTPAPTTSPTSAPTVNTTSEVEDRGDPAAVAGISGPLSSTGNGKLSTPAFVGITMGSVLVVVLALFARGRVVQRQKAASLKRRVFTADEDDDDDVAGDDDEVPSSNDRRVRILGEDDDSVETNEIIPLATGDQAVYTSQRLGDGYELHDVRFIPSVTPKKAPRTPKSGDRSYLASDTVAL